MDWWAIIFNPSFPLRYVHMLLGAFLATAFVVAGIVAWHLLRKRFVPLAQPMFRLALFLMLPLATLQMFVGDATGLMVGKRQPAKLAAMEGQWETGVMSSALFASRSGHRLDYQRVVTLFQKIRAQAGIGCPPG